ncbi:MAG: hypothetical protein ACI8RE_002026 [Ilumatobacter sp.]|jgi:hypothetical protein
MEARAFLYNDPEWEYQSFDVVAVAACVFAPALMWIAEMTDRGELLAPRESISSYHDVLTAGAFFIPLTVAVMLFVVNGWIYAGHRVHVAMGVYLLGVIVFDHVGRTRPLHFVFAGAFFVVGAFLEAVRDSDVPDWSPLKWILMAPILPGWILFSRWSRVKQQGRRAGAILLPFAVFALLARVGGGWIGDCWLFFAEWIALAVLVIHYLCDARSHAHKNAASAVP